MSDYICVCADPSCLANGCRRMKGSGNRDTLYEFYPNGFPQENPLHAFVTPGVPTSERHRGVGEGSWAVFAERMLDERDAAREEVAALRAQIAALAENGVSFHKAEAAGRQQGAAEERERILAWIDRKLVLRAQSVFFRGLRIGRLGIRKGIAGNEHRTEKP